MDCVISTNQIAEQIEQTWIHDAPASLKLDDYAACLSRNWSVLSESDRNVLLAGGAALFDVKLKDW